MVRQEWQGCELDRMNGLYLLNVSTLMVENKILMYKTKMEVNGKSQNKTSERQIDQEWKKSEPPPPPTKVIKHLFKYCNF